MQMLYLRQLVYGEIIVSLKVTHNIIIFIFVIIWY